MTALNLRIGETKSKYILNSLDDKRQKVLITGHAGFIGHHFVRALKDDPRYFLVGVDNLANGKKEYADEIPWMQMDVNDLLPSDINGFDYVIHFAALPRVSYSLEYPRETNYANVSGTLNLLWCAKEAGIKKFIYSSSSSVYGDNDQLPLNEETHMPAPMNPYALQKYTAEYYCEMFRKVYGLPTVSLRYFNVYGEDQDGSHPYATVVAKFLELKKQHKPLTIFGDGEQTRDMTYVGDVVQANVLALEKGEGVYNIGGGKQYSVNQIADWIGGSKNYLPPRPAEARHTLADISKAKEELGWSPTIELKQWIKKQSA